MNIKILDSIDFQPDFNKLLEISHIKEDSEEALKLSKLIDIATEIGRPKVMYREVDIDSKGEDYVLVEGVKLTSNILRKNLESADKIYPYIATSGKELADFTNSLDDVLEKFWMDKIMEVALNAATVAFDEHLNENHDLDLSSGMNPGSLDDWPITEQRKLFDLLGDPYKEIGVKLTESNLMLPIKTLSGIRFYSDTEFVNCMLCDRENCQDRRAEYDHILYQKRYKKGYRR